MREKHSTMLLSHLLCDSNNAGVCTALGVVVCHTKHSCIQGCEYVSSNASDSRR